jgi:hypothetical protein
VIPTRIGAVCVTFCAVWKNGQLKLKENDMKSKKDASPKAGIQLAVPAKPSSRVPSAIEIAPARVPSPPVASVATKTPAPARPIKIIPAAEKSKAQPLTTVQAKVDVGFGNALFIRGQGDGLSWDQGRPLECVDGSTWVWSTKKAAGQIEFKLLINDQIWAEGENQTVAAGQVLETTPAFN